MYSYGQMLQKKNILSVAELYLFYNLTKYFFLECILPPMNDNKLLLKSEV